MSFYKNESGQTVAFLVRDSNGDPLTGDAANITAKISLNYGTAASTNDVNPTEHDTTNHPGVVYFNLTQAETNAAVVIVTPASSTSGVTFDPVSAVIYTTERPSVAGDQMDLVDAPNATAITAIQAGLSTFDHTADTVNSNLLTIESTDATDYFTAMIAAIWEYSTRTITGLTQAALALFTNTDTGETSADAGSVAKLSQNEDQRGQSSW